MAGDWIKMRGALLDHPKVIAIARELHASEEFREWLTPGGGGPTNGQIVSVAALRGVTVALLMKVWSGSREHGRFDDCDLHLPHSIVDDLDQMAGAPGVGAAMAAVGWAVKREGICGVFLPNFKEFNVPMTPAEKQSEYRKRQLGGNSHVTKTLPATGNKTVTREEKRREEENKATPADAGPVWQESLTILTEQGQSEKTARAFLGMLCRDYEETEIAEAVKSAVGKANATAYIRGVLKSRPKKGERETRRLAI